MNCRAFVLALCLTGFATLAAPPPTAPPPITVYFSPRGGCTDAITAELGHATNNVLVQAYSFTSAPIAKALVEAHKRGVKIEVVLDKSQRSEKYSSATFVLTPDSDVHRRFPRHRTQQNHHHRPGHGHHGVVQLQQGGGREQRGEPAGNP